MRMRHNKMPKILAARHAYHGCKSQTARSHVSVWVTLCRNNQLTDTKQSGHPQGPSHDTPRLQIVDKTQSMMRMLCRAQHDSQKRRQRAGPRVRMRKNSSEVEWLLNRESRPTREYKKRALNWAWGDNAEARCRYLEVYYDPLE